MTVTMEDGTAQKPDKEIQVIDENNKVDEVMLFGGKSMQFHCDYCHKDITGTIRIKCAECDDFDLCVECFSVGVELRTHKNSHSYRVSDCLCFPVVNQNWTADEEVLLLEGIELFGIGNWKDIAEHIGTKTERYCEQHYIEDYLNSPTYPLPVSLEDKAKYNASGFHSAMASINLLPSSSLDALAPNDNVLEKNPVITDPSITSTPVKTPISEKKRKHRAKDTKDEGRSGTANRLQGSDLAGYMPLRGDFDVEHENDAELILADMEFNSNDSATEREMKLNVIDIYNRKLDEREFRKKFVIDRNLLDYKKHQQIERRRPKDEREIEAQLRVYSRFQTPEEHNNLVSGLLVAARLRKRIKSLFEYRRMGIRSFAEADEYEAEKKRKQTEVQLRKERENAPHIYGESRMTTSGRDRTNRWLNRDRNPDVPTPSNGHSDATESSKVKKSKVFDIHKAHEAHLLSAAELELCQRIEMLPKHFFVVKDLILREQLSMGKFDPENKKFKLDVVRVNSIYDFMIQTNLIKKTTKVSQPIPEQAENINENITANIAENITGNVTENITGNVTENVAENATGKGTENLTENVTEKITQNIKQNITENVAENITQNITENVTENTTENVTENITESAAEQLAERVDEECTKQCEK